MGGVRTHEYEGYEGPMGGRTEPASDSESLVSDSLVSESLALLEPT